MLSLFIVRFCSLALAGLIILAVHGGDDDDLSPA